MADNYRNSYQRWAEAVVQKEGETEDEAQDIEFWVTDLKGKLHSLSGNIEKKLGNVKKSVEYWKDKQDTKDGKGYYSNMTYLHQQILLFLESKKIIA